MFLHLSVILFMGGVSVQEDLCPGVSVQGGLCPGGSLSRRVLCPAGYGKGKSGGKHSIGMLSCSKELHKNEKYLKQEILSQCPYLNR